MNLSLTLQLHNSFEFTVTCISFSFFFYFFAFAVFSQVMIYLQCIQYTIYSPYYCKLGLLYFFTLLQNILFSDLHFFI